MSLALLGLYCGGTGCLATQTPQATTLAGGAKRPELGCMREGAERVDVASWRGTGRPDVARVYKREGHGQTVLACREVDLNGDGHKDVVVYFESDGRKQREEFDQDYDGIADVKSYYEQGRLVRQELDINHDGKADLVQYFEEGKMIRVERLLPPAGGQPEASSAAPPEKPAADAKPGDGKPAPQTKL